MPLAEPTDTARTLRFPAWATWLHLRRPPGAPGRRAPPGCPPRGALLGDRRQASYGPCRRQRRSAVRSPDRRPCRHPFSPSVRNIMAKNCAGHVALAGVACIASERSVPPICLRSHPATWHSPICRHEKNDGVLNICAIGRVPGSGVGAVDKWPAVATVQSQAEAGHLSTAVVIACLR